jgi:hypothetical protein
MKQLIVALCLLLMLAPAALGSDSNNNPNLMPVDAVRPGMKGYGLTVFQGSTPEKFGVEILGVLDGMPNPKQSTIIARLTGPQVDRSSVFAGMSGSPVYIDGKLVGAVAYAFPFAKEAIAGITPIQEMIEIFEQARPAEPRSQQRLSFNSLMAGGAPPATRALEQTSAVVGPLAATTPEMTTVVGQTIVPIATPVTFTGIPQAVVDLFGNELKRAGIQTIAGVGGASRLGPMVPADDETLLPGSSVSVQLVRGDFTIDAAGTVTYRDGNRIYAFGHPFLSSGQTSWPMAESSVVIVVPNLNNSFKLSAAGNLVGSINQDRATGVYGKLGEQPRMVPVRIAVHTSRNKTEDYNFQIISDSFLTPLLMKITSFAAITATERQLGNQTIKLTGRISLDGQPDVVLDNGFSATVGAGLMAVGAIERPLALLLNSGFDALDIRRIDIDVVSVDSRSNGSLNRLWVDKTEVRRGETIEIQAFARNDNGAEFVERIPLTIPADAPIGSLAIVVGDGASLNQLDLRTRPPVEFNPRDLGQLVRAINKLKKNNRLYVRAVYAGAGAVVNNEEMPALPPSVLATLGSQRTSGGFSPLSTATLFEQELSPSQFLISGQQSITINVIQ